MDYLLLVQSAFLFVLIVATVAYIKAIRRKRREADELAANPVLDALAHGHCPDCGNKEFLMGPQGGMGQNIKCGKCGHEFNVAPFDGGWIGPPMFADRIVRTEEESKAIYGTQENKKGE